MSVSLKKLTDTQLCKLVADLTHERDALLVENARLKLSREILAKNALETCGVLFQAGYETASLKRGMLASTGDITKYPSPIRALVDEAVKELETPATGSYLAEMRAQGVEMYSEYSDREGIFSPMDYANKIRKESAQ